LRGKKTEGKEQRRGTGSGGRCPSDTSGKLPPRPLSQAGAFTLKIGFGWREVCVRVKIATATVARPKMRCGIQIPQENQNIQGDEASKRPPSPSIIRWAVMPKSGTTPSS